MGVSGFYDKEKFAFVNPEQFFFPFTDFKTNQKSKVFLRDGLNVRQTTLRLQLDVRTETRRPLQTGSPRLAALMNSPFLHIDQSHTFLFVFHPFLPQTFAFLFFFCLFFILEVVLSQQYDPFFQQPGWRQHSDESVAGAARRGFFHCSVQSNEHCDRGSSFKSIKVALFTLGNFTKGLGLVFCFVFLQSTVVQIVSFFWFRFLHFKKKNKGLLNWN